MTKSRLLLFVLTFCACGVFLAGGKQPDRRARPVNEARVEQKAKKARRDQELNPARFTEIQRMFDANINQVFHDLSPEQRRIIEAMRDLLKIVAEDSIPELLPELR